MEISKDKLERYLPTIEEFLTSLLLEETGIEVDSFERAENKSALAHLSDTDIYLYTRELNSNADVILVLDHEWFGLLSSIMLGIEEKEKNDKTIELLEEFSDDLSQVITEKAGEQGLAFEFGDIHVLSKGEMQTELKHEEYLWTKFEIEGIADDKVRAEFLLGDPETAIEPKETEEDEEETAGAKDEHSAEISSMEEAESEFATMEANEASSQPKEGRQEEVVSARRIEFAEFAEEYGDYDGEAHSMDLLKDVELDVSVELGRIELPLGKVLELAKGSVIELEKLAGEPVDILVNGNRIALGEVVVIDEHFGVRISSLVTTKKRLAKLKNGS